MITYHDLISFMYNECGLQEACDKTDIVDYIIHNQDGIQDEAQVQVLKLQQLINGKHKRCRLLFKHYEKRIVKIVMSPYSIMTEAVINGVNRLMVLIGYSFYITKPLRARWCIEALKRSQSYTGNVKNEDFVHNQKRGMASGGLTLFPHRGLENTHVSPEFHEHGNFNNEGIISIPSQNYQELNNTELREICLQNYKDNQCTTTAITIDSCIGTEFPDPYYNE